MALVKDDLAALFTITVTWWLGLQCYVLFASLEQGGQTLGIVVLESWRLSLS